MKAAELARQIGVSQPTVHGWINEGHGITWANARRVAKALNVAPAWIMFGTDEEAERVTQTAEELTFLRLFREQDDDGQRSILKYLTVAPKAPTPRGTSPPRPTLGGSVTRNKEGNDCGKVVPLVASHKKH